MLARLDRGALPSFGVMAIGVHVTAWFIARRTSPLIARRARNKLLDPGKLDHVSPVVHPPASPRPKHW